MKFELKAIGRSLGLGLLLLFLWVGIVSAALVDNSDGTVSDTDTGLMWQRAEPGSMKWQNALSYCEDLVLPVDGYNDWRLPDRFELQSLIDYSRFDPCLDKNFFPGVISSYYWSSTTLTFDAVYAWRVGFDKGDIQYYMGGYIPGYYKSYSYCYVRAVRIQSGPFVLPHIHISDSSVNFGDVQVGATSVPETLIISNQGDADLELGSLLISGTDASYFSLSSDTCEGTTLPPDGSCNVGIVFGPDNARAFTAELQIISNDPDNPTIVTLTGNGVSCTEYFYRDNDEDNYGDPNVSVQACALPIGFVVNNLDQDDNDNTVYPDAPELCDGKDNDQDGYTDENCSSAVELGPIPLLPGIPFRNEFGTLYLYGSPSFDPDLPTVVISHGWNSQKEDQDLDGDGVMADQDGDDYDPDYIVRIPSWQVKMAADIKSVENANVLLWEWQEKAKSDKETVALLNYRDYLHGYYSLFDGALTQSFLGVPFLNVEDSGKYLAYTLAGIIPNVYSQEIHFIGHSLGSGVIACAAKRIFTLNKWPDLDSVINVGRLKGNIKHLTFLDSPWHGTSAPGGDFLESYKYDFFLDNYWSQLGKLTGYMAADVNIFLCEKEYLFDNDSYYHCHDCQTTPGGISSCCNNSWFSPHSYSHAWYRSSITNFSSPCLTCNCDDSPGACNEPPSSIMPYGWWWHSVHQSLLTTNYEHYYTDPQWELHTIADIADIKDNFTSTVNLAADVLLEISSQAINDGKSIVVTFYEALSTFPTGLKYVSDSPDHSMFSNDGLVMSLQSLSGATATAATYRTADSVGSVTVSTKLIIDQGSNNLSFKFKFPVQETDSLLEIFINDIQIGAIDGDYYLDGEWYYSDWLPIPSNYIGSEVDLSFRLSSSIPLASGQVWINNIVMAKVEDATDSDGDGFTDVSEVLGQTDPYSTNSYPDIHVNADGYCNGKYICYPTINQACRAISGAGRIKISQGSYLESLVINEDKQITMTGGWNIDYTTPYSESAVVGSLTISSGCLTVENLTIGGTPPCNDVIPDTGQTQCYDDDGPITCPALGEPFYGQDAQFQRERSYTKLDANGNDLPDVATEWFMVRDNVTGLIWEVKQAKNEEVNYSNPHDADNTYTWYDDDSITNGGDAGTKGDGVNTFDTDNFTAALNATNYGGYSDWRLPTAKELAMLVDRAYYIDKFITYFPNTVRENHYRSSTSSADDSDLAWSVSFGYGYQYPEAKSNTTFVRAARSESSEIVNSLVINNNKLLTTEDDTVTDASTGLMWQRSSSTTTLTWEASLAYCQQLNINNFAGYNDWRLPDINEFLSIVNFSNAGLAIYEDPNGNPVFIDSQSPYYWSSTTYPNNHRDALPISFIDGGGARGANIKTNSVSYYVRAVRSGQFEQLTLLSLNLEGQAEVYENSGTQCTCIANYSDGSQKDVTAVATWNENSDYAGISATGYFSTDSVSSDQSCLVAVSYDGMQTTKNVIIKNQDLTPASSYQCPTWDYGLTIALDDCLGLCPCPIFDYESSDGYKLDPSQNVKGIILPLCDCENIDQITLTENYALRISIVEPAVGVYFTNRNFSESNYSGCTLENPCSFGDGYIYLSSYENMDTCPNPCDGVPKALAYEALDYEFFDPSLGLDSCCLACAPYYVKDIQTSCFAPFFEEARPYLLIDLPTFVYDRVNVDSGVSVSVEITLLKESDRVCSWVVPVGTFAQ